MRLFQVLLSIVPIVVTPLTPLTDNNIKNAVSTYLEITTIAKYGVIAEWDTVGVTDMGGRFFGSSFNGDLSKWNTGAVTNMAGMFAHSDFNGDISEWNTGAVTNMYDMFSGSPFNGDISKWNTGAVTDMTWMFAGSPFNGDLSKWNTGEVVDMFHMFDSSEFKRTLCGGKWDSLSSTSYLTSTGRLECCPAGSFMSDPLLDPFSAANSCSSPCGSLDVPNDETSCPPPVVKKGVCTAFVIATGECTGVTCNKNHANLDNDASNGCEELSRVELKKMYSSTAC